MDYLSPFVSTLTGAPYEQYTQPQSGIDIAQGAQNNFAPLHTTVDPGSSLNTGNTAPGWLTNGLAQLPQLPSLIYHGIADPTGLDNVTNAISGVADGVSGFLSFIGKPSRLLSVVLGVTFVIGGLYIFGSSQVSSALLANVRRAAA